MCILLSLNILFVYSLLDIVSFDELSIRQKIYKPTTTPKFPQSIIVSKLMNNK